MVCRIEVTMNVYNAIHISKIHRGESTPILCDNFLRRAVFEYLTIHEVLRDLFHGYSFHRDGLRHFCVAICAHQQILVFTLWANELAEDEDSD